MDPARPRAQPFSAGIIKSVSSDGQNAERSKKQRSVATIPTRAPGKTHVTGEKHSEKHQNCHGSSAVDLHPPSLCTHLEITGRQDQIIPIRPCRAGEKEQRKHAVKQASVKGPQSD